MYDYNVIDCYVDFTESIDKLCDDLPHCRLCILGDFNLPLGLSKNYVAVANPPASPDEVQTGLGSGVNYMLSSQHISSKC